MVERRDPGRGHSHQYFPICNRWFWKLYELQPFITTKCFRSHCTHIISPLIQAFIPPSTVRFTQSYFLSSLASILRVMEAGTTRFTKRLSAPGTHTDLFA